MKPGFVSAILPDASLVEVLSFAGSAGYQTVEIMCWPPGGSNRRYAGVMHIDATRPPEALVEEVQSAVASSGVEISGLGYYPNCLSADRDEAEIGIEHLKRVIALAPRLGLNLVNTFIGREQRLSIDDNWPRLLEVWRPMICWAEDHDVRIAIENCPMLFTRDEWPGGKNIAVSPNIWRRIFNDLPSCHLGLNFDPSHFVWQQMDYLQPLGEFAAKIFHLHLKDARIERARLNQVGILAQPLEYHTPCLPGRGDIDWKAFLQRVHEVGFRGAACVEVEDREFEATTAGRQQALIKAAEFLSPIWPK